MKKKYFIPYGHQTIDRQDIKEVINALKSNWITQGPKIEEFEKAIARYCGAKYAVVVSSGTAALHAAYATAGIGSYDEVITSPITFAATANMISFCGAKPVFVDIKKDTLTIDPKKIEKKINRKTKAIVPVDFAGHPADYDQIIQIAKKHGLLIIEDAAHSLGARYKGKKIGSISDMTILSFHPVKVITTGEGGAIITNNRTFYEKLKIFRQHGIIKKPKKGKWYYEIKYPGFNYRLTDFQCALGLSQLKKIDKFIKRRREIVTKYNKAFKDMEEIITPTERNYVKSAWHIYVIQLRLKKLKTGRKKIFEAFQTAGLGVQVHYIPLQLQPFYQKKFGYKKGNFPIAEHYYERAITLPLFPKMTNKEIDKVIKTVIGVVSFYREFKNKNL